MADHSSWDRDEREDPDKGFADVFDARNEPTLNVTYPPGTALVTALRPGEHGPVHMPTLVAYKGHPDPNFWFWGDGRWNRCGDAA